MPFKQLVYWSLRCDDLCKGPDECDRAIRANEWDCTNCHTHDHFEPDERPTDVGNVYACDTCSSTFHWSMMRCKTCPVNHVMRLRLESEAGKLLDKVVAMEHEISTYKADWNEIPSDIGEAHKVLIQSRQERQNEMMDRHRIEQERAQARQQLGR